MLHESAGVRTKDFGNLWFVDSSARSLYDKTQCDFQGSHPSCAMELQNAWNNGVFVALLLMLVFLYRTFCLSSARNASSATPPSPPAWPIIGHLHLLSKLPHQKLAQLSAHYGPLFSLQLGSKHAIVASSAAVAKEFFSAHDQCFANRPVFQFCSSMLYGYGNGLVFTPLGSHWREMRKMFTFELFSPTKLRQLQYIKEEEVDCLLESIRIESEAGKVAIDVGKCVAVLAANTVCRMLHKKKESGSASGGETLQSLTFEMAHVAVPTIGDFIPYLSWLGFLQRRRMKNLHKRADKMLDAMLNERKIAMAENPSVVENDFLQVLLSKATSAGFSDDVIKGTMLEMLGAGIDTSVVTVEWAMAELLRNPRCMHKLREEIDTVVASSRRVTDTDVPNMSYLKQVVKETFRLHPPAPFLLPRISSTPCKVGDYSIPANTQLLINTWAIGRDAQFWKKADEFDPERFEEVDIEPRGQNYELLPFGAGRRICPGMTLGLSTVQVTLANLVHSFDWELPDGQTPQSLDMHEKAGISMNKATPVLAIPKPRF